MNYIVKRFGLLFIGLIFLTACGSKVELSDYVELQFNGYDSIGTASYSVDDSRLVEDVFGVTDDNYWELGHEEMQEISNMVSAYSIELVQDTDLSNGDEVTVRLSVDEEKTKELKTKDEITFEVTGLEEPTEISDEEIDRNVIVNFNGASGRGTVQIDTTFDGDLYDLWFETDQDGTVANGDTVIVSMTEESRNSLAQRGYALSGEGHATFEASGLDIIAAEASDINNLVDIERMIGEGIIRSYQDSSWGRYTYDIIKGKTYYRQFEGEANQDSWSSSNNGTLITLYTVNELNSDEEVTETLTAVYGFSNIILDENGNTNVTRIEEYRDSYDHTYSLESVEKMMEGYGFVLVE